MQNRKLEYEQQRLEKEVEDMQEAFDAALALLSREKLSLEADVKAAEIKRLTYQQEMQLLKVMCLSRKHQCAHFRTCSLCFWWSQKLGEATTLHTHVHL